MRFDRVFLLAVIGCQSQSASTSAVELIPTEKTENVAGLVAPEVARAAKDGKKLVVYVGAVWCEPCTKFHDAAAKGELDAGFGDVRFIMFDLDRDQKALDRAGYSSEMVPLFAIPKPDGTASGKKIEGSIKGDGAVTNISPRLRKLVDEPPS